MRGYCNATEPPSVVYPKVPSQTDRSTCGAEASSRASSLPGQTVCTFSSQKPPDEERERPEQNLVHFSDCLSQPAHLASAGRAPLPFQVCGFPAPSFASALPALAVMRLTILNLYNSIDSCH
jgi:hypothetical protein